LIQYAERQGVIVAVHRRRRRRARARAPDSESAPDKSLISSTAPRFFRRRREPGIRYYRQRYRVNYDGGGLTLLTTPGLDHFIQWSPDGRYFLDTAAAIDKPPAVLRCAESRPDVVSATVSIVAGCERNLALWDITFYVRASSTVESVGIERQTDGCGGKEGIEFFVEGVTHYVRRGHDDLEIAGVQRRYLLQRRLQRRQHHAIPHAVGYRRDWRRAIGAGQ
jgi:hypothetical protein